jgi:hypothetical protein
MAPYLWIKATSRPAQRRRGIRSAIVDLMEVKILEKSGTRKQAQQYKKAF